MPTLCALSTTVGEFHILAGPSGLLTVTFPGRAPKAFVDQTYSSDASGQIWIDAACNQLQEYLAGRRQSFDIPLDLTWAAPFAQDVYRALAAVPFGISISYGELAAAAGHPGAARAVGSAMKRNPMVVFIPCHRVVGANGPGGWSGPKGMKSYLMDLENRVLSR